MDRHPCAWQSEGQGFESPRVHQFLRSQWPSGATLRPTSGWFDISFNTFLQFHRPDDYRRLEQRCALVRDVHARSGQPADRRYVCGLRNWPTSTRCSTNRHLLSIEKRTSAFSTWASTAPSAATGTKASRPKRTRALVEAGQLVPVARIVHQGFACPDSYTDDAPINPRRPQCS